MAGLFSQVSGWLGLADETESLPARPVAVPSSEQRAVTRVTPMRPRRGVSDISEIFTMEPRSYQEAPEVAENFRVGIPVIVNMSSMSEADSKRMLDFMLGLKEGLEGHLKRVTPKVFLLTPNHVAVNDEEQGQSEASDDLIVRP